MGIVIDKLTRSIENRVTGEKFDTEMFRLTEKDGKFIKKKEWQFDWHKELKDASKEVFKLSVTKNPDIIQGMISIEDKRDHILVNLIESAKFNRGKSKLYDGVAGNLFAYACKVSFEKGYNGFVSFISKTKLKQHYQQSLNAEILFGDVMIFKYEISKELVQRYFKEYKWE
ncbi:MAG: hypothetical protein HY960_02890 [Ignavibacteriae bacterium]|nr:hypothetical protein [Ignavibacteriota bacterium]